MIWRVAPRSVLPSRIENSSDGAASSIGERANQKIQPQNPSAEAAKSRSSNFSRSSIGKRRRVGRLDDARIINVKADGRAKRPGRRFNSASWSGRAAQLAGKMID